MHPLSPLLVPLLAAGALALVAGKVRGWPSLVTVGRLKPLLWSLGALLVGVWLARFGGAFGGPVAVQSLLERWSQ